MLENGKYYVGDLCYLFGDDGPFGDKEWMPLLKRTNYLQGDDDTDDRGGYFEYEGHQFFSSSTLHGDGCYEDQHGRIYGVDAGIIGCFPVAAFPEGFDLNKLSTLGNIVEFSEDFTCDTVDECGDISIGNLIIATGGGDDNEEDEEDRGYEEEDSYEDDEDDEDEDGDEND